MLSKQEQMKEAASLAEKLTQSILMNLREHVGITKKECEELKNSYVYDDIFDSVVESYRGAMCTVEERDGGGEE